MSVSRPSGTQAGLPAGGAGGKEAQVSISAPRVLTVLPPRERFASGEAGAIALLVRRMAESTETVAGLAPAGQPFAGVRFAPVVPVFRPFSRIQRYVAGVAALVRSVRPDLIEVHNRPDVALALRKACPGLPVSLVLHNDPCGMRRARTAAEREHLGQAVAVVAVSEWVRGRFISQGVTSCVRVLPNSLDLSKLPPPVPQRDPVVLFAGRIVADKGADAFVAACVRVLPRHAGWRADMIGADRFGADSPETPFLTALRAQARQAGVALLGYQPHEAVMQAMSRAAIVVVPSRWPEPFGMAALEAMGCGAAVVASHRGGLPDVVGEAGLYADPDDPDTLAAALEQLIASPALRAEAGQAGRARARLFDAAVMREKRRLLHEDLVREWRWKGVFRA
ncbi:glycosyltransferase family 4 protein [Acetobacter persici]|uniref:glycosyltransferase family 4 protein n=1 Tax=Acetobacter persici TaxID=1076596 RepID=UPI001BAA0613|nr:glycosyltransferase family 4 protein [Acetobacter persici]MBS1016395.1 glycosyltransferase family 4 protein [Acetobacter persici]